MVYNAYKNKGHCWVTNICRVRKSNPSEFQILSSESPILLFNKKITLSYELEVLTSEFRIPMDWAFWFPCIWKSNPSEIPILFIFIMRLLWGTKFEVLLSRFELWWIRLSDNGESESPTVFYLYYEIALGYEIWSSVIKIWNSDGLDFLALENQKV